MIINELISSQLNDKLQKEIYEKIISKFALHLALAIDEFSNYLKIESWVQWRDGQGMHNYKVSTFLYDWR